MDTKDLEELIDRQLTGELERLSLRNDSIYPIPDSIQHIWQVFIDGKLIENYSHLAAKSKYGVMNLGISPDLGQHITFQEPGGGGSVIIPFVLIQEQQIVDLKKLNKEQDYQVYAGLIEQQRDRQGGLVWNVPRGYVNQGDSHDQTAAKELIEETGLSGQPFLLPGRSLNPNSSYFETGKNNGVRIYAINLGPNKARWQAGQVVLLDNPQPTGVDEKIGQCQFFPLAELSQLGDMFSVATESRLRYYLDNRL
ncbi:NUDIX domain-containing protein [Candidatus Falkowbacteria bacterium]|nr:NUDIX domain-containing protein [Candidatus Falkowbacteria bacterium]